MRKEKGITLIALVITVIILLILAGVAMSMITGNDGLFTKANEAATVYNQKAQEEAEQVQGLMEMLDKYAGGSSTLVITRTTTPTSIITAINNVHIGDYIDLGTSLLDTTTLSGIEQKWNIETSEYEYEQSRNDELIKADYRIFYAEDNMVYAILTDYLPNNHNIIDNSGIENIQQVSGTKYCVTGTSDRNALVNALAGPYSGSHPLLISLVGSKLNGKNVSVALSPTLEEFQKSYIAKNKVLYDGSIIEDKTQTLYLPRLSKGDTDSTWGYWLATLGRIGGLYDIYYTGNVNSARSANAGGNSVRPVVALGSDVDVKWNETRGVWEVQ